MRNQYRTEGEITYIRLKYRNRVFWAKIDTEDLDRCQKYTWFIKPRPHKAHYIQTTVELGTVNGVRKCKKIYLHRLVMNAKKGEYVDHINHDTFDVRKSQLRICTNQENTRFRRKSRGSFSSSFKGVSWDKRIAKWISRIYFNNKSKYLGHFNKEIDAAKKYNMAAKKFFGDFAVLNVL